MTLASSASARSLHPSLRGHKGCFLFQNIIKMEGLWATRDLDKTPDGVIIVMKEMFLPVQPLLLASKSLQLGRAQEKKNTKTISVPINYTWCEDARWWPQPAPRPIADSAAVSSSTCPRRRAVAQHRRAQHTDVRQPRQPALPWHRMKH